MGDLRFGLETFVLSDVSSYDIWPDEMGIVTMSASHDRQIWIEFNFVERLKEVVPPLE